jgi:hypothetical protein
MELGRPANRVGSRCQKVWLVSVRYPTHSPARWDAVPLSWSRAGLEFPAARLAV